MRVKVEDPSGQTWRVSRRWVPWRRRVKGDVESFPDVMPDGLGDDPVSAVIAAIALVLIAPFVVLVVVVGAEFLLLLLLLPFAVLGRVLLGRHWAVEVRRGWKPWWEVRAGDWQDSASRIHDVAAAIRRGELPEQTLGLDAAER